MVTGSLTVVRDSAAVVDLQAPGAITGLAEHP